VCGNFELLLEVIADSDEEFLSVLQRLRAMVAPGEFVVPRYRKAWMQEYAWRVR
jgi:hypothetical protein